MEGFKGTKGKWTVKTDFREPTVVNESDQVIFTHNKGCYDALEKVDQYYSHNKMMANAQLIAAAPELLKQLQECQDMITKMSEHNIGGGRILGKTYISNVWKENEKVLNKALNK